VNADELLRYYEQIADAPEAVTRLRRFVLDLAVRGTLVAQDLNDERASVRLGQVAAGSGSLKLKPGASTGASGEAPFPVPTGWCWTTLGALVEHSDSGWSPKTLDHERAGDAWGVLKVSAVSWGAFRPWENKQVLPGTEPRLQAQVSLGDFLISRANTAELVARAVIVEEQPLHLMMSDKIVRLSLVAECSHRFVLLVNNSAAFARAYYADRASGVSPSMKNVTREVILGLPIPLPPLAEQHRIVAKVDELMTLCDRLEAARAQREAARDRLARSCLARLDTPDPETFREDARFALDALPALTARPDQIKQLRQTILNLAVRGKLVAQDGGDESAFVLHDRARKAKALAFEREGLRERATPSPPSREDLAFDFPTTWALACFDDAFVIVSGVTKGQKVAAEEAVDVPYLRVANVQRGRLDLSVIKSISVRRADMRRYALSAGDILMTEGGDWDKLGRAAIWRNDVPGCIHQNHVFRVRSASTEVLPEWVVCYVNSPLGRAFFEDAAKQTTNLASINMTQLRSCPLPLPPAAEQQRIVAKVDELMALCNRLEGCLTQADEHRRRLLEALLHQALEPAATLEEQAA
jgi:type I restriction enzyme S subunit